MQPGIDPTAKALLALGVIILGSFALGALARRVRQPHVVGVLVFGIFAATLFHTLSASRQASVLPATSTNFIHYTGQVGLVLLVFVIGCHLRQESARPNLGRLTATAGLGFLVPLVIGSFAALAVLDVLRPHGTNQAETAIFIGSALAVTAVPVLAVVLDDLRARDTVPGLLAMTTAVMNDGLVWAAVVVLGVIRGSSGVSLASAGAGAVVLAVTIIGVPLCVNRWLRNGTGRDLDISAGLPLVVAVAVVAGAGSDMVGVHPIVGALAAGLTFPRSPGTSEALDNVSRIANLVLAPVFFVDSCRTAPLQLFDHVPAGQLGRLTIVLVAAIVGKVLSGLLIGRVNDLQGADRARLAILLNCRGVTEIAVAAAGEAAGLITPTGFLLLYLVALCTTALTAPVWRGLDRRSAAAVDQPDNLEADK